MKKIFCLLGLLPFLAAFTFAQKSSMADELLKWKQLYDAGAITEQEFNAQKAKILNSKTSQTTDQASKTRKGSSGTELIQTWESSKGIIVIDVSDLKGNVQRVDDEFRIINATHEPKFKVYVETLRSGAAVWKSVEDFNFSRINDIEDTEPDKLIKFEKIRIRTTLTTPFIAKTLIDGDDLKILLLPKDEIPQSFDYEIDVSQFPDSFKTIKIFNKMNRPASAFDIFGKQSESSEWERIGAGRLVNPPQNSGQTGGVNEVKTLLPSLHSYRYFALLNYNQLQNISYNAKVSRDSLIIEIK
ncbi:MAG: SHOCT domain-containing protein [Treponema sp.]|nr:SHOCT domain-containing protein [Treponema sp.]